MFDARTLLPRAVTLSLVIVGCGVNPPTQLMLAVDSDLPLDERFDRVSIEIETVGALGRPVADFEVVVDPRRTTHVPLPFETALVFDEAASNVLIRLRAGRQRATVDGFAFVPAVERRILTQAVANEVRVLCVELTADCIGMMCGPDDTCVSGTCVPTAVDARELPVYSGADDCAFASE